MGPCNSEDVIDDERDFYRELFEHSPDAILVIEGDRFVDCNPAAVKMMRFPSKEALLARYSGDTQRGGLRAHPAEFSPPRQPDGRDSFEKANEMMAIAFERGSHRFEWAHIRADGEVFPVEVQLTVIHRGEKPILHVAWREIGERKRLEAELRQAQRMEAVGRLAGGIAHDFNNLLVVILSHAELLQDEFEAGMADPEHVAEIRSASERAAALTHQLLAFSRGQPIQPRPIDLVRVLEQLGALLRRLIGEHVELDFLLPKGPITIEADASQIEQLVMNLATNARDAMPQGGRLEIELACRAIRNDQGLGRLPSGEYAVIRVTDSGIGMTQEQLERAFDPFFTTKPQGEGTGLGLATVHATAEQNGGAVFIESKHGVGTCVEVLLPLSSAEPVELGSKSSKASSPGGGETILVVEDERSIRGLLEKVLRAGGYHVLSAADGAHALEVAYMHSGVIDLLLTDVVMPKLSGPELVKRISKDRPGMKVMYMSGFSREGTLTAISPEESAKIIEKPFSPKILLAEVRRILSGDGDST